MDIPADKYKSDVNRPGPFLAVLQNVRASSGGWLAGVIQLTEEEQKDAGIYYPGDQRYK